MPSVKDLEYSRFKKDSSGNLEYTSNKNSKVVTEISNSNLDVTVQNTNLDVTVGNTNLDVTVQNSNLDVTVGNHSIDSFGRLRVSQSLDILDNKNISSKNTDQFNEVTVGAGAIAYTRQTSSVQLSISETNLDRALRETRYLYYIPGKGQNIVMTGVIANADTDDMYVVTRTSTSGSAVDTTVIRSSWDDPMDGTGSSGKTIDFSKAGIFKLDFQWLGVGKVKFSVVNSDGGENVVYESKNSFLNDNVYMRTGSLPMRYEIVSDGSFIYKRIGYFNDNDGIFFESVVAASVGTHTLKEICCSASTDGGVKPVAIVYHSNTRGNSPTANNAGVNVLAVKLLDSYQSNNNRKTADLLSTIFFADDKNTIFEVYKVTSWTDTGTTWSNVNTVSACEYAAGANISLTVASEHMVACNVVAANSSGSKADSGTIGNDALFDLIDENRIIKQNYDSTKSELFLIKAFTMPSGSTTSVGAAMTWLEQE